MKFCPLFSGSSGNASVLCAGETRLLIDAGLSGSAIISALKHAGVDPCSLNGILVTHEHTDHIKGVGVLSRRFNLPVYANAATWEAMSVQIGEIAPCNVRIFETGRDFYIKQINATPYSIPHDAAEPVGYSFYYQGRKLSILTDLGYAREDLCDAVAGSELLLLESNHDIQMLKTGPYSYPLKKRILGEKGHLSNHDAGSMLVKLFPRGVKRVILGHLSKENNNEQLALDTVAKVLFESGISPEKDVQLFIAHRDRTESIFKLG